MYRLVILLSWVENGKHNRSNVLNFRIYRVDKHNRNNVMNFSISLIKPLQLY